MLVQLIGPLHTEVKAMAKRQYDARMLAVMLPNLATCFRRETDEAPEASSGGLEPRPICHDILLPDRGPFLRKSMP